MDIRRKKAAIISLEAAIVSSIFILGFFMVFSVFNIIKTQVYLQNTCNQLVREISEESYIFRKIDIEKIADSELLKGVEILDIDLNRYNFLLNNITLKQRAKKYLFMDDTDDKLKRLGVIDGLGGLQFISTDKLNEDGQITLLLRYSMINKFSLINKNKLNFILCSTTISLGSELKKYNIAEEFLFDRYKNGICSGSEENPDEDGFNIWDITPYKRTNSFKKLIGQRTDYLITDDRYGLDFYDNSKKELIYIHSMNTVCKSYVKENSINRKNIETKFSDYLDSMIIDMNKRDEIVINGSKKVLASKKCKLIIILNDETKMYKDEYYEVIGDMKKSDDSNTIDYEIELIFSDGKIEK